MPFSQVRCYACDSLINRDDAVVVNGSHFCANHVEMYYNFCHACGRLEFVGQGRLHNGQHYCIDCGRTLSRTCDECGVEITTCVNNYFGTFCSDCAEREFAVCSLCESTHRIGDIITLPSGSHACFNCEYDNYDWTTDAPELGPTSYNEINSELTFGIEIETARCKGFSSLKNTTPWSCTNDYSISGKEFVSPPLQGDSGLQTIREFCDYANAHDWAVDSRCGLHLHVGVNHLEPQQLKSIAYAYHLTYDLWQQLVPHNRAQNSMCGRPNYDASDIFGLQTETAEDWDYFVAERDRFEFINWRAYIVHGTVEIRLLDGTLDSELICNWIKTHTKFIEHVMDMSLTDIRIMLEGDVFYQFSAISEFLDMDLTNYYVTRSISLDRNIRLTASDTPF